MTLNWEFISVVVGQKWENGAINTVCASNCTINSETKAKVNVFLNFFLHSAPFEKMSKNVEANNTASLKLPYFSDFIPPHPLHFRGLSFVNLGQNYKSHKIINPINLCFYTRHGNIITQMVDGF